MVLGGCTLRLRHSPGRFAVAITVTVGGTVAVAMGSFAAAVTAAFGRVAVVLVVLLVASMLMVAALFGGFPVDAGAAITRLGLILCAYRIQFNTNPFNTKPTEWHLVVGLHLIVPRTCGDARPLMFRRCVLSQLSMQLVFHQLCGQKTMSANPTHLAGGGGVEMGWSFGVLLTEHCLWWWWWWKCRSRGYVVLYAEARHRGGAAPARPR